MNTNSRGTVLATVVAVLIAITLLAIGFSKHESKATAANTNPSISAPTQAAVTPPPTVPEQVRAQLAGLGHKLEVRPPRTPNFGYGQAVLYDARTGVKFGASDPRHDGEAVPVPAPAFEARK